MQAPKNRKPKSDEIELCGKYLEQEIEMTKPEFLIPLGYHATKYILDHYCRMISIGRVVSATRWNKRTVLSAQHAP